MFTLIFFLQKATLFLREYLSARARDPDDDDVKTIYYILHTVRVNLLLKIISLSNRIVNFNFHTKSKGFVTLHIYLHSYIEVLFILNRIILKLIFLNFRR